MMRATTKPRVCAALVTGLSLVGLVGLSGCAARSRPPAAGSPAEAPAPAANHGAAALDAAILAAWKTAGVTPAPIADDGEFLRRVTLDLAGRVPTLAEVRDFTQDRRPEKRAALVDRLLGSPGFGEHFADLTETLLYGGKADRRIEKDDPRSFLVGAFNDNWPYDRLTTALVATTGTVRDNGAAAFLAARIRGGGGPEAAAGAVARIFLGLQIQCAQCHDHPYDKRWRQVDFHHFAAYFARTRARRDKGDGMMEGKTFELRDLPRGEAKMQAPGTTEPVPVQPLFLGRPIATVAGESRRQTVARAIVGSDLFAKAMVGRTWAQLFGAGLVDPWDDLGGENDPKHPALLNLLAQDFRASGFDTKALVRRIVLSTAYARGSAPPVPDDGGAAVRAFARARVRPLAPEQLFRSLLIATGADEMVRERQRRRARPDDLGDVPETDRAMRLVDRTLREYRFTFEDDEMADADFDGTLPQVLLLFNGEFTNNGTRAGEAGVLASILARSGRTEDRITEMFLAAYARPPSAEEVKLFRAAIEAAPGGARKGFEDAFFALLTSTEMTTNH
jgi:Protein of unknown function (DUF1549)/Protein of unknown function (DUF1553)